MQFFAFDSVPSLIFATLALAKYCIACVSFAVTSLRYSFAFAKLCLAEQLLRHISRRFTSCVACQRFAIASPIDATRCFSTTFLCLSFSLQSQSLPCLRISTLFSWLARLSSSFGALRYALLLRCLCSLCVAIARSAVHRFTLLLRFLDSLCVTLAVHCRAMLFQCRTKLFLLEAIPIYSDAILGLSLLLQLNASTCRSHSMFFSSTSLPLLFRVHIVPDE